jgi:hypothetical protein
MDKYGLAVPLASNPANIGITAPTAFPTALALNMSPT